MASGSHFFKFLHQIWQWHGSKFKKTRPGGMRAALKSAAPGQASWIMSIPVRTREGYPPLPSRRPCTFRRAVPKSEFVAGSKSFFSCFFLSKILFENLDGPKLLSGTNLSIFCRPGVDFRRFWVPKQVPAAYFFGVFSKTVLLLKSCSRCGGSTIFKV